MHPPLRMIASGLAAVLLGACFDFDATMAGGLPGASGPDATTGGPDGGATGGGIDGSFSDAPTDGGGGGNGPDGGHADTGSAADGGGGAYCASLARPPLDGGIFFCDDF